MSKKALAEVNVWKGGAAHSRSNSYTKIVEKLKSQQHRGRFHWGYQTPIVGIKGTLQIPFWPDLGFFRCTCCPWRIPLTPQQPQVAQTPSHTGDRLPHHRNTVLPFLRSQHGLTQCHLASCKISNHPPPSPSCPRALSAYRRLNTSSSTSWTSPP